MPPTEGPILKKIKNLEVSRAFWLCLPFELVSPMAALILDAVTRAKDTLDLDNLGMTIYNDRPQRSLLLTKEYLPRMFSPSIVGYHE